MSINRKINLQTEKGLYINFNEKYIKSFEDSLLDILDGQKFMNSLNFARNVMLGQEIKSNNVIEGIKDDLSIIDEVIADKKDDLSETERKRIINLYHGYQYILTNSSINKDSLKELYSLLSDGLLDSYAHNNMGTYYRTRPVYILKGNRLDAEPYEGFQADKIDYYMEQFFEFIHSDDLEQSPIDKFVKSQIMHFYFVYVHPFFDVNGRTSRTTSMWYLLNKKNFPYIIFNRAIAFSQREYEQNIIKGRSFGDITLFLKYMLESVYKEIEKELIIHSIEVNANILLTKEDKQMLEYFFSMNGNLTIKDLRQVYNIYNNKKNSKFILEKLQYLLDKQILVDKGQTKSFISYNVPNIRLGVNKSFVDVDKTKFKYLKLDKYI